MQWRMQRVTPVSVIVPTLNSASTLQGCLESVLAAGPADAEIVIVDANSKDATVQVARRFDARVILGLWGRSSARRIGAESTNGDFLLFLDSDQHVERGLIQECLSICADPAIGAVNIPEKDAATGFWKESREIDREISRSAETEYPRFFRRTCYAIAGGHSDLIQDYMEDRDLFLRLKAAGAKVARSRGFITNQVGRVRPVQLGIKGAISARDARRYYDTHRGARETLGKVAIPRLRNLVSFRGRNRHSLLGVLSLELYIPLVYGPRLVIAVGGRLRSSRTRT